MGAPSSNGSHWMALDLQHGFLADWENKDISSAPSIRIHATVTSQAHRGHGEGSELRSANV